MASTSYSSWPSTSMAGGLSSVPWYFFTWLTFTTGWILMVFGSSNLQALSPTILSMGKGPTYLGLKVPDVPFRLRFRVDSRTLSPASTSTALLCWSAAVLSLAWVFLSYCLTRSHTAIIPLAVSVVAGTVAPEKSKSTGNLSGLPNITKCGLSFVLDYGLLLYTIARKGSCSTQFYSSAQHNKSYFKVLFVTSAIPSVWG